MYMLVYLLPLFSLSVDLNTFNILLTNFLILIFIYINAKAENFQFNIVLFLKRYEIFVGETINGDEKCILMKEDDYSNLKENQEKYKFIEFCQDVYILKF